MFQKERKVNLVKKTYYQKSNRRDFPVEEWIRICLPVQGAWVQSLIRKIPHAMEQLSSWVTITEPKF